DLRRAVLVADGLRRVDDGLQRVEALEALGQHGQVGADALADGAVLVALDALGLLEDDAAPARVARLALALRQVGQQLVELVLRRRDRHAGVGQRRLLGEGLAVPATPGRQLRLPVALV